MKNKSWKPEEELLLVNLYFDLKQKGIAIIEADDQIKSLSDTLSCYARKCGYEVDASFRNVTGIKMKLRNIEYLDTNGKKGLSAHSRLGKIVDQYKTNNAKFLKNLSKANKMIFDDTCGDVSPRIETVPETSNKTY